MLDSFHLMVTPKDFVHERKQNTHIKREASLNVTQLFSEHALQDLALLNAISCGLVTLNRLGIIKSPKRGDVLFGKHLLELLMSVFP